MSRLILSIFFLLPLIASAQKFGVVNERTVLESLPDYVFIEKQIAETSQKYHAEYDKMSVDIDKKFEEYQTLNNKSTTPKAIRERRVQEIQDLQKRAQQFLATAEEQLIRQREELLKPIEDRLRQTIARIGAENGYTFIFPESQPLYIGVEVDDLTEMVLEQML